jgi:hypothetical protein
MSLAEFARDGLSLEPGGTKADQKVAVEASRKAAFVLGF